MNEEQLKEIAEDVTAFMAERKVGVFWDEDSQTMMLLDPNNLTFVPLYGRA